MLKSLCIFISVMSLSMLNAAEWQTYRGNIARSGITTEKLPASLKHAWTFQPTHAPRCAWGEPNPRAIGGWFHETEGRRVQFDDTFHVAIADGLVYFGSSADGCVYALDAKAGNIRWSFITGGPVRLAPTYANGKIYVGSDDGFIYCLNSSDGSLIWKYQAAPKYSQLLGSGQMISRWPVRTGVLVDSGTAYFGAGVFPAEGVFIYAIDAETGKLQWCNDKMGAKPHSRFSPQGYLLASKDALYVPTGRVSPAALDRKTGKLLYETYFEHTIGGTYALLVDDHIFTGTNELMGYDKKTKARYAWFPAKQIIVNKDRSYTLDGENMRALDQQSYPKASLRRENLRDRWNRENGNGTKAANAVKRAREQVDLNRKEVANLKSAIKKSDKDITDSQRKKLSKTETTLLEKEKSLETAQKNKDYNSWMSLLADIKSADESVETAKVWNCKTGCSESLILAGSVLYAGGNGEITAVDNKNGEKLWNFKVEGKARGLAVAEGHLIVSTDTGAIYCFSKEGAAAPTIVNQPVDKSYDTKNKSTPLIKDAVTHILKKAQIDKGFVLIIGCGTGEMAMELARRTKLTIYGLDSDKERVAVIRNKLQAAGILGTRVRIDHISSATPNLLPYPDYFANLIVSETALTGGKIPCSASEMARLIRPLGGMIYIGTPASDTKNELQKWASSSPILKDSTLSSDTNGTWLSFTRGALPGAGRWTQEYAGPGNTTCGDDTHLKCPLGVLWYGSPGPAEMAERHTRASAPLSANGRMFIQGEGTGKKVGTTDNVIMCYDAYNGVKHWERRLPGALRVVMSHDGANAVVTDDSYYIITRNGCTRLSAATGETTTTYSLPDNIEKGNRWGYLCVIDKRLYGTWTKSKRVGNGVFCIDVDTGKTLWTYSANRIPQGSISIGDGKLFLSQANVTPEQRRKALSIHYKALEKLKGDELKTAKKKIEKADVQLIVALDVKTGKALWEQPTELTGAIGHDYWCSLGSIYKNGVLVLFGVYADGHYWKQFFAGKFETRRVFTLDAAKGTPLWTKNIGYRVRPIVIGNSLHAEPWAFDLHTGKQKTRINPVTGREEPWQFARPGHHCGCPAASENMLLFRSLTLGWYDLLNDFGTQHFGSLRTGCWINFIPANGLLMVPEGGSGCMCAFPTSCTVVFENSDENRSWAYYSTPGEVTPVKKMALNLGAPGDRRSPDGTLWLGYPRPRGSLVMQLNAESKHQTGGTWFCHDPLSMEIKNTDTPWVYRSGLLGAKELTIPLVGAGEGSALYTVKLAFADIDKSSPDQRVFNIKLQGKTVAEGVDVVRDAGGGLKAIVKEFKAIKVDEELKIEIVSHSKKPSIEQLPVLQGVEIIRKKVLSIGVLLPEMEISNSKPKKNGTIRIANFTNKEINGVVRIKAPEGFKITPSEQSVKLASANRLEIPITTELTKQGKRAKLPVEVTLVNNDGETEWKGQTTIDYLGHIERIIIPASEDAWVAKKRADHIHGTGMNINIDGGDRAMGDGDHAIAYMKFKLNIPGKPIRSMLRLLNDGNPTGDSGEIKIVTGEWTEKKLTYKNKLTLGRSLAKIGKVVEHQQVELQLPLTEKDLSGETISLAINPTSTDGVSYTSRECKPAPELVIEYTPE